MEVNEQLPTLSCRHCSFNTTSDFFLQEHLVKRHRSSIASFSCNFASCKKSFKTYEQFVVHYRRKHGSTLEEEQHFASDHLDNDIEHMISTSLDCHKKQQLRDNVKDLNEAIFVLKLMTVHQLSKAAVQNILQLTEQLFKSKLSAFCESQLLLTLIVSMFLVTYFRIFHL